MSERIQMLRFRTDAEVQTVCAERGFAEFSVDEFGAVFAYNFAGQAVQIGWIA